MSGAYYNEVDSKAAAWLRELIKAGLIADGEVDERSIVDVRPDDLRGFVQCHFFAGLGGWSYALRLAGWPDERPVWTGSCPCQPFSAAGKRKGTEDERHLWPEFFRLIRACHPDAVMGEQVASGDGLGWLDHVFDDLEGADYATRAVDLCAAGFGAPHIRQRLFWAAGRLVDAGGARREEDGLQSLFGGWDRGGAVVRPAGSGAAGGVAHGLGAGLEGLAGHGGDGHEPGRDGADAARPVAKGGGAGGLADAPSGGRGVLGNAAFPRSGGHPAGGVEADGPGPVNGLWRDADWLYCRDGKWRPVEPGTSPLVDGLSDRLVRSGNPGGPVNAQETSEARVMRLRGYGNAIVADVAEAFIRAVM